MRFAFLRGVNVGGKNKLPMKELVKALSGAGFGGADYLLQSGNLALPAADMTDEDLREGLESLVAASFGVETRVVLRTPQALAHTLALNPFPDHANVHLAMWDGEPTPGAVDALTRETFADAAIHLVPGAAFLSYTGESHTSKLNNKLLERRLGVSTTARNLRTLGRMLERWPA